MYVYSSYVILKYVLDLFIYDCVFKSICSDCYIKVFLSSIPVRTTYVPLSCCSNACHDRYEVQVNKYVMTYMTSQVDSTCAEKLNSYCGTLTILLCTC